MESRGRNLINAGLIVVGVWFLLLVASGPLVTPLTEIRYRIDDLFRNVVPGGGVSLLLLMVLPFVASSLIVGGIAVRKGRNLWPWFFFGLFFPLIALIVVLVIKTSGDARVEAGQKKCPHCGEWVDRSAAQCRYCLGALPTPDPA